MRTKLVLLALALAAPACTSSNKPTTPAPVSATETVGLLRNGFAVLLDVREPVEAKDEVAEGATRMPLSRIRDGQSEWQDFSARHEKDKQIVVYGSTPAQASEAAAAIAGQGFKVGVLGAFDEWKKAGLPVRKP